MRAERCSVFPLVRALRSAAVAAALCLLGCTPEPSEVDVDPGVRLQDGRWVPFDRCEALSGRCAFVVFCEGRLNDSAVRVGYNNSLDGAWLNCHYVADSLVWENGINFAAGLYVEQKRDGRCEFGHVDTRALRLYEIRPTLAGDGRLVGEVYGPMGPIAPPVLAFDAETGLYPDACGDEPPEQLERFRHLCCWSPQPNWCMLFCEGGAEER